MDNRDAKLGVCESGRQDAGGRSGADIFEQKRLVNRERRKGAVTTIAPLISLGYDI